jgi:hypothetical protein
MAGSQVHGLVLTDIAAKWTKAVAMIIWEQTLGRVGGGRSRRLPLGMLGLDGDGQCLHYQNAVGYSLLTPVQKSSDFAGFDAVKSADSGVGTDWSAGFR